MIRLLIASPFPAMRAGLRILLNQPDFQLVDDVTTNDEILDLADTLTPQVIVYDLALDPDGNFEALIQFRRTLPMVRVLGLSESPADPRIMRAMQAGMRGCLPKTASGEEIANAVRQVAEGILVLPPTATNAPLPPASPTRPPAFPSVLQFPRRFPPASPLCFRRHEPRGWSPCVLREASARPGARPRGCFGRARFHRAARSVHNAP